MAAVGEQSHARKLVIIYPSRWLDAGSKMSTPVELARRGPVPRRIASGVGWSIEDVLCDLGPDDKPSEEQFNRMTIAAVLDGTFECGTRSRKALL